jgi:hypothetical protein
MIGDRILEWLKKYEPVAHWLQGLGVVIALVFGGIQLRDTKLAIEASTIANEITLRNRLSEVIIRINEAALNHPEVSSGYSSTQRIHLLRLEYFFQVFNLHVAGIINDDRYETDTRYLKWTTKLPEFIETWKVAADQYPTPFRQWVDSVLK